MKKTPLVTRILIILFSIVVTRLILSGFEFNTKTIIATVVGLAAGIGLWYLVEYAAYKFLKRSA